MSSIWRELRAIELALASFKETLKNSEVKRFTDNQSCVNIVQSGSMKYHLQSLAYNIFKFQAPRLENENANLFSNMIDQDDWGVT